ncbi:hypothetical protein [Kribbella shirazensis]|uniref:Uncharacterized protein n=1 Tax=Kribbella shirazensis TaxID=1105143 RepID=A0A7X5VI30_9ACTN|nr:hypothetical protein [Kribbella shirazensis]NIK61469.1 hypothetical protein [Kribbella shirazensis]
MRPDQVEAPARCSVLSRDARGYPIIATIPQDADGPNFGGISEERKLVLATYDLCGVCAGPFRDELRWMVTAEPGWERWRTTPYESVEAPVHEVCALYAAQVCPFVSSPFSRLGDEFRRGQRRAEELVLVGFEQTTQVTAISSPIQPDTWVLAFRLERAAAAHVLGNAEQARDAYRHVRVAEAKLQLDEHELRIAEVLSRPTKEGEDSGAIMAGGAWYVGAAFCPRVARVVGLQRFGKPDSFWNQLANAFLLEPAKMEGFEEIEEPATRVAVRWFRSRKQLPTVLVKWLADERTRRKRAQVADRRAKQTASAKRKDAKAARRKGRR